MKKRTERTIVRGQETFDMLVLHLTEKQVRFIGEYLKTVDGERSGDRLIRATKAGGYAAGGKTRKSARDYGFQIWLYSDAGEVIRALEGRGEFLPDRKSLDERLSELGGNNQPGGLPEQSQ